jgi:hypothetical protein
MRKKTVLRMQRALSLCFFILAGASSSAWAANFYVDSAVSASGNGQSWSGAWKRFSDINWLLIRAGDTLYISGGSSSKTYYETLTVGASGSSGLPITITKGIDAGHNGTVILDEQNTRVNGVASYGKSHIVIERLNIRNIADSAISVKSANGGVIIQNNFVDSGGHASSTGVCTGTWYNARGYDVRNSSGVIVRKNVYHTPSSIDAQTDGIWLSGNRDVIVDSNLIYVENNDDSCHNDCIQAYQNIDAITISNNRCESSGSPNSSFSNYLTNNNHGFWVTDTEAGGVVNIYNNVVYMAHPTHGIGVYNPGSGYTGSANLDNNTIYGGHPSVFIGFSPSSRLRNNIIWPTQNVNAIAVRIDSTSPAAANIDNNLIWAPTAVVANINGSSKTWADWQSLGYDSHGLNSDPKFANVGALDFHISAVSPAIDRGATLSAISIDLDQVSRPQGAAYDIGAYEFKATAQNPTPTPTPPPSSETIAITSPADKSTVAGSVVINVITSSGVAWVNFYIDNSYVKSSPPYSMAWDTTKIANGTHSVLVEGKNSSGTLVATAQATVQVSNMSGPTYTLSQSSTHSSSANSLVSLSDQNALTGAGTNKQNGAWVQLNASAAKTTSSVTIGQMDPSSPGNWGAQYLNGAVYQYYNGSKWVTLFTISGLRDGVSAVTFSHAAVTSTQFRILRKDTYWLGVGEFAIH